VGWSETVGFVLFAPFACAALLESSQEISKKHLDNNCGSSNLEQYRFSGTGTLVAAE
jgi:hypothetical protein